MKYTRSIFPRLEDLKNFARLCSTICWLGVSRHIATLLAFVADCIKLLVRSVSNSTHGVYQTEPMRGAAQVKSGKRRVRLMRVGIKDFTLDKNLRMKLRMMVLS